MAKEKYRWTFYRSGGVDQVVLGSGDDIAHLEELDQKLWLALSCPTRGLEFDTRTLDLIDTDHDGHIRPAEILAAVAFARDAFVKLDDLFTAEARVPLSAIKRGHRGRQAAPRRGQAHPAVPRPPAGRRHRHRGHRRHRQDPGRHALQRRWRAAGRVGRRRRQGAGHPRHLGHRGRQARPQRQGRRRSGGGGQVLHRGGRLRRLARRGRQEWRLQGGGRRHGRRRRRRWRPCAPRSTTTSRAVAWPPSTAARPRRSTPPRPCWSRWRPRPWPRTPRKSPSCRWRRSPRTVPWPLGMAPIPRGPVASPPSPRKW